MALGATICKATLSIADIDRGYYADHALTVARHPSETEERMMVRVVAFVLHAGEGLGFGRGVSTDDEPDLWRHDPTGAVELWIEVGLPDERRLRKACHRAHEVVVLAFGGSRAELWWAQNAGALARYRNLVVLELAPQASSALAAMARRNMALDCTIQDGEVWIASEAGEARFQLRELQSADRPRIR